MPTANTQQALRASWSARIPPPATGNQTVAFGRRSQSVRNISYPRGDHDGELGTGELSKEFLSYDVHIPPTPDNQPMDAAASTNLDPSISARVEEQYVSNSLFTGGFNSVTRAQLMNKVIDSESIHPQMAGAKGSSCSVPGCGAKVMSDERGNDILPCECDYKICRDCFVEGLQANGFCPGCKEPYKAKDLDEVVANAKPHLSLQSPSAGMSKMERRLSLMKSRSYGRSLTRNQTGDFDHSRWLFETKGTYGYGNAIWPRENDGDGDGGQPVEVVNKPWRPLTRRLKIPAAVLSPYR